MFVVCFTPRCYVLVSRVHRFVMLSVVRRAVLDGP